MQINMLLRRRCTTQCIFLPYFPPSESHNFEAVHRIFGASNFTKMLQRIPADRREDAVKSMVYEERVRVMDPVYGRWSHSLSAIPGFTFAKKKFDPLAFPVLRLEERSQG
ncbi:hypothetical protein Patl1_35063 [Pistacia atlantica]|uniref:Uncharacterized protein n=1 Tax=Pistacia atlantica TaxID=434234 RepID=A0ACC0ZUV0_9ROSI|nr:hypothetical protein Patl1_35063 [Pistacia atlantica]